MSIPKIEVVDKEVKGVIAEVAILRVTEQGRLYMLLNCLCGCGGTKEIILTAESFSEMAATLPLLLAKFQSIVN